MSTTIGDLVQRVRWRTNTEQSTFVTDQELTAFVNDALAELDDVLVGTYEDYKLTNTTSTITTNTDGQNNFTVPSDFLKARLVERQMGTAYIPLDPFSLQEHPYLTHPVVVRNGFAYIGFYRLEGNKVEILPWQNAAATYRLWYIPSFTPLTATFDANGKFTVSTATLPVHMDTQAWHAFAVAATAAVVQAKQDLDASVFQAERETQRQRVIAAAATRDAGKPKRVVDVRGVSRRMRRWGR